MSATEERERDVYVCVYEASALAQHCSASMPSRSANIGGIARRLVDEKKYKTQNELRLIDIVVGLLEDGTMNPYKGSVPVERIQNVVRCAI